MHRLTANGHSWDSESEDRSVGKAQNEERVRNMRIQWGGLTSNTVNWNPRRKRQKHYVNGWKTMEDVKQQI